MSSTTAAPTPAVRAAAESSQAAEAVHPHAPAIAGYNGTRRVPAPVNEPVKTFAPGTPERAAIKNRLTEMASERIEIPIIIGGKEFRTGETATSVMPHNHRHVLADYHKASAPNVRAAIDAARHARREWANWAWEDRAAVFLRAAELLATTWRSTANASTMLGQSKTVVPGGDRRGVRADRLLALQPRIRAGALRRAAAVDAGDVEPARLSAARGIRLRGDAVQLHVDRRQPAHRAGAHGQHGDLEARVQRDALGVLPHAAARGGGIAAGRDQLRAGRRGRDLERAALAPRSRRRALHRQHERLQQHVADDRREHATSTPRTRGSSARRAGRTSSSRTRRPIRRRSPSPSRAAGSSTRGRSARRRAGCTSRGRCGRTCATASSR